MPAVQHKIETRGTLRATEVRASKAPGKFELTGRAASYSIPTKINDVDGPFMEQVGPGAFDRSLRENADVKATFNHDPNQILGRTKSGTLFLSSDSKGLNFRCILDPTNSMHKNVHASVSRGDHSECSFAFRVPSGGDSWGTTKDEAGQTLPLRTLLDVDLIDVAPAVTYPAYGGDATQVSARSAAAAYRPTRSLAEAQGTTPAALQSASDAARRSVARAQGKKIEVQVDADLRRRAAAAGAQIATDDEAERKHNRMLAHAEDVLGIVFGRRSKAEKLPYPYVGAANPQLEGQEGSQGEFNALQSALEKSYPGHKLLKHSPSRQEAYTKHSSGSAWTIPYEKDSAGYRFGKPSLGHPTGITAWDDDL